jgi:hypothetical protein
MCTAEDLRKIKIAGVICIILLLMYIVNLRNVFNAARRDGSSQTFLRNGLHSGKSQLSFAGLAVAIGVVAWASMTKPDGESMMGGDPTCVEEMPRGGW